MTTLQPEFQTIAAFEARAAQNALVLDHWKSLRQGESVPSWSQFDLLELSGNLENCMLLEYKTVDNISVLLFGTKLVDRLGMDLTGSDFLDFFDPIQREAFQGRVETLKSKTAFLRTIMESPLFGGNEAMIETLHLPFQNAAGVIDRGLLSVYELEYRNDATPLTMPTVTADNIVLHEVVAL